MNSTPDCKDAQSFASGARTPLGVRMAHFATPGWSQGGAGSKNVGMKQKTLVRHEAAAAPFRIPRKRSQAQ